MCHTLNNADAALTRENKMRNTNLKTDFESVITEVRLGEIDGTVGRIVIEAENYINYLEAFEDRSRKFEDILGKMEESNDPTVLKVLEDYFKEFKVA